LSLFDERELAALMEQAAEKALRKVLREEPATPSVGQRWVSTAQLAREYSLSQSTIRRWIRQGKIRSTRVCGAFRVNLADFEALLSSPSPDASRALSPEELADRDEARERRSSKD
jgi:excisionase family DNA binding protein